ncbi:replisome organizer, partial [Lactococcus lactis]|nr:replisome organizer [Lactococcus lactis]MUV47353.1 replisome organizer [Lactococcus lactis]
MFSKEVTTSDLFVDMPSSSQLLYFHLGMEADDEGFIGNAKMLSRAYGSNNDDL